MIKKILLATLISFVFVSCSSNDDDSTPTPTPLPVVIDYHQYYDAENREEGKSYSYTYKQDGLKVEIIHSYTFDLTGVGNLGFVGGGSKGDNYLKISNVNSLQGLSEISFKANKNNSGMIAVLFDRKGEALEGISTTHSTTQTPPEVLSFTDSKVLSQASYIEIRAVEGVISEITFK